jgi:hypothetical protein
MERVMAVGAATIFSFLMPGSQIPVPDDGGKTYPHSFPHILPHSDNLLSGLKTAQNPRARFPRFFGVRCPN